MVCVRAAPSGAGQTAAPRASPLMRQSPAPSRALRAPVAARRASGVAPKAVMEVLGPIAALDIDWSDPDTQIAAAGALLGIGAGLGIPIFFVSRDRKDEERLEELRALNRQTFKETGEYLSPEEIESIRPPRWTDRREFVDDD